MSILQFSETKQFLTRLVRLMEQRKKGPTCSNAFSEVIEYAILIVRLLDYKYLIGVAMLLKIRMVRLEDPVEIEKIFPNPGEAINFKKKKFSVAK